MDTKETSTYYAVLIAATVIGIIILYFIISATRLQRRNLMLNKEKLQAEMDMLEKERARMAADLHDDLGPTLSAIKFKIASMENNSPGNTKLAETSMYYIDGVLTQLRNIAFDLMPITLLRNGLVPAVREFISHIGERNKLEIEFDAGDLPELPQKVSIHVYRILQEIIHNTIKHAGASKLKIIVYLGSGRLHIATADNGKGFDSSRNNGGMGLNNLRNRTEILSGEMYIKTYPLDGTRIFIELPLPAKYKINDAFKNTNKDHPGR